MINKISSITAVVVTYNRKKLLIDCLNSLLGQTYQLNSIIIIDNASNDGTSLYLKERKFIDRLVKKKSGALESCNIVIKNRKVINIEYVRLPEDTGSAGGYNEGIKRAFQKGSEWIWIMDDDAEPKRDCLAILIENLRTIESSVAAIAPTVVNENDNVLLYHRGFIHPYSFNLFSPINRVIYNENSIIRVDHSSYIGLLISSRAIQKVGLPYKDFFIWLDDLEYCLRLNKYGMIFLVRDSYIIHKDTMETRKVKFVFNKFLLNRIHVRNYWKIYYGVRNQTYIVKKLTYKMPVIGYFYILILFLKIIGGVILFDDYKLLRIKLVTQAIFEGLIGKLGRNDKVLMLENINLAN